MQELKVQKMVLDGSPYVHIVHEGKTLYTICQPSGPARFIVGIFEGEGLDENDEETKPLKTYSAMEGLEAAIRNATMIALQMAMENVFS